MNIEIYTSNIIFEVIKIGKEINNQFICKIFENLKIGIFGFNEIINENYKNKIMLENGIVIFDLEYLKEENIKTLDFVIVNEDIIKDNERILKYFRKKVIKIDWIDKCIQKNKFISPDYFYYFNELIKHNYKDIFFTKDTLKTISNILDISNTRYNIFNNFFFYIDNQINKKETEIIKEIIILLGGMICTKVDTYLITHIVVNNISNDFKKKALDINCNVNFIHINYIKNCCKFGFKLEELEYPPNYLDESIINDNSKSLNSLSKRKSVILKSYLFEDKVFHFDENLKDDIHKKLKIIILENSGNLVKNIDECDPKQKIYFIWDDGFDSKKHQNLLKKFKNGVVISKRFIYYCLENKQFYKNYLNEKLSFLHPLPHKIPFNDFIDKKFILKQFDYLKERCLKGMIKTVGGIIIDDNDLKNGYLICPNNFIKNYKEKFPDLLIKEDKWIFKCINEGKFID